MKKLNEQQYIQLAKDLDAIRDEALSQVGEKDAKYIRTIIRIQRLAEIFGRITMVLGFLHPLFWLLGVILLSLSKILDNMEIGHNVLHGQYDWMNDANINSRTYEWDIASDAGSWKRVHNFEHHTYTNIIGKDRDYGYGLLRLSDDIPWRKNNSWQLFTYVNLSLFFEWGIAYHELAGARVFFGRKKADSNQQVSDKELKKKFFSKAFRQIFKDYIFFPLIAGPMFLPVLLGNLVANFIRNLWTSTVIFCGHFTKDAHTFSQEECKGESRGQWYHRQMLGSSNFTGHRWFHILTGHLSCQIEHHLFPDIPAHRYIEISKKVEVLTGKYQIPYNSGSFIKQYATVLHRIYKYSFPAKKAVAQ
ncbi:MAG: acyl-CoA desaturase [Proteobacteria bacterium]|nr:acyl-CoA desaturase [Pseudomonadota bacterium]